MTELTEITPARKLLVIAPNWLGDAIMMTPLLDYLEKPKNYHDGVKPHITLGIRNTWSALFKSDPRIDNVMPFDRGGLHGGIKGLFVQARLMGAGVFDAVLLCPPSLRVGLAAWLARIPHRLGYATDGRSPLLTTSLPKNSRGQKHYSQEMLDLGQALGVKGDEQASILASNLPGCQVTVAADMGDGPPVWVMAPGTTYGQAKTWPERHVATFLDSAVKDKGVRVLLLGDGQTKNFVKKIRESCSAPWRTDLPGSAGIIDMTGKTDLMQVVAYLKSTTAFVGNDSGLMHLAGALEVPTVGLFGSSNPDWTAPLGKQTLALTVPGFPCRPCYRKTCNQPEFCLDKLHPSEVFEAVTKLLKEKV